MFWRSGGDLRMGFRLRTLVGANRSMNRTDLQALAEARVADARVLLDANRWAAAYYLLGYAVECGMKACAVRQFRQYEVPDKTIVNDFYTHRLDRLLNISGVKAELREQGSKRSRLRTELEHGS